MAIDKDYDICVIGGGAAGLVTAAGAATLGAKVLLVEQSKLGGDCLYSGCVPSKTLIHSASVAYAIRHAERFGLNAHHEDIDQHLVMQRIAQVIKHIEPNDSQSISVPWALKSFWKKLIFLINKPWPSLIVK